MHGTDECEDESDCSGHGSCIDLKTSWYPSKQCFCNSGWFGDNCARSKYDRDTCQNLLVTILKSVILSRLTFSYSHAVSLLTSATISPAEYALRRELHPKLTMYAKIDGVSTKKLIKVDNPDYQSECPDAQSVVLVM